MTRVEEVNAVMESVPEYWRHRWCAGAGPCACMGAANCSGKAGGKITYDEWKDWRKRNPEVQPIQVETLGQGWLK